MKAIPYKAPDDHPAIFHKIEINTEAPRGFLMKMGHRNCEKVTI